MNSATIWPMRWPSMEGEAMEELNRELAAFRDALSTDALAVKRAELGIVSFAPVNDRTDDDKPLVLASRRRA